MVSLEARTHIDQKDKEMNSNLKTNKGNRGDQPWTGRDNSLEGLLSLIFVLA